MTQIRKTAILTALCLAIGAQSSAQETKRSTPEEVALVDEGEKGSVLRHFPSSLRLYTWAKDTPGRSNCNLGCASRWPPVFAPVDATDLDDFTVVMRDDGRKQWAYRGKPLYMRYHDAPNAPAGDGDEDGAWRVTPYIPAAKAAEHHGH